MLSKNKNRGKCPFRNLKICSDECVLYRKGVRYTDDESSEPFPIEECALNIIADNLESMHNRTYMMQKEVGEAKNVIALNILKDLNLTDVDVVKTQTLKVIDPKLVDDPVLLEDKKDNNTKE